VGALAAAAAVALAAAYAAYRAAWNRRLHAVWGKPPERHLARMRRLRPMAGEAELRRRAAYLEALRQSGAGGEVAQAADGSRESYRAAAAAALRSVESDIARRAVTVGLVIGLNRNALLDSLTIAAAAFELQLHVLTRLGKRPSPRTWVLLIQRTAGSLFLNTYVSREDALYLNLAIRKAAMGLEVASESVQKTADALADVDWDEVLGGLSVPGLSAVSSLATMGMSVGAFGLRQIGAFIEATSNDLLQGVLAGGVLYYHGMALAAECLSLDEEHRRSPEMTRTIGQAMETACVPAGRLLREQVRRMREFLRERRRLAMTAAKEAAKEGLGKVRETSSSTWDSMKQATRLFRP
jgi:hypothetical protein